MIRKFSLLEELELSECSGIYGNGSIEAIAKSCPQLNHFRMIKESYYPFTVDNDVEALAISGMHGLRSLELYHNGLTNNGLITILDSCVHLELLIIRECPSVTMDDALLAKCARVMIVTLRGDDYAYYRTRGCYSYYRGDGDGIWIGSTVLPVTFLGPFVTWWTSTTSTTSRKC